MKSILYILLGLGIIYSCGTPASTNTQTSYSNSNSSIKLNSLNKVMVFAMTDNSILRQDIENAYVQQLGSKGTASYAYFQTPINEINQATASQKLAKNGYDGAIVVRLSGHHQSGSKRKPSVSIDPSIYMNFHGNIGGGIGVGINPGYNTLKDVYDVNTFVYQIPQGELLWTATTEATNPSNMEKFSNQMAEQVFSKMKSEGFD